MSAPPNATPPARIVNAAGYLTRIGNSVMAPPVLEAMAAASQTFVELDKVQYAASDVIEQITGAQAGYVVGGAAAGLAQAAAACIAGTDVRKIERLPDTLGMPHEILVPEGHEMYYERFIRLSGARLTFVADEEGLKAAISQDSVGIFFEASLPGPISREALVAIGHSAQIPVIADAAVAVPPASNLRSILQSGVDLVVFTGSKAIRGPASSGFVAGRRDLVAAIMLQHQDWDITVELEGTRAEWLWGTHGPFVMGMGRAFKVGKEDIAGLLTALRIYDAKDHAAEIAGWEQSLRSLAAQLADIDGIETRLLVADGGRPVPLLEILSTQRNVPVERIAEELRSSDPSIWLSMTLHPQREVFVDPVNLRDGDDRLLVEGLRSAVRTLSEDSSVDSNRR